MLFTCFNYVMEFTVREKFCAAEFLNGFHEVFIYHL